jgi:uncharacterized membrane protein
VNGACSDLCGGCAATRIPTANHGLRAFYFALAALTWFLHPWLFVAASAFVVYVLYQREFHSTTLHALTRPSTINQSLHLPKDILEKLRSRSGNS